MGVQSLSGTTPALGGGAAGAARMEAEPQLPVDERVPQLAELVRRRGAQVWRSLRYLGVHEADIADASQEVFLVVHRRLHEFRGDSKLETWLYGICLGIARNARRKQQRAPEALASGMQPCDPQQEAELEQKRLRAALQRALDAIAPEQREVFVLHEIEGLGMRAIAQAAGCPLFTAYSRLRLARKALERLLADEGGVR